MEMSNTTFKLISQGAEAKLYEGAFINFDAVVKDRFSKKYRHPILDVNLIKSRTKAECRAILKCRKVGIPTPPIYFVDMNCNRIFLGKVPDSITVNHYISQLPNDKLDREYKDLGHAIGGVLAKMHRNDIIHGDLTTSNMLLVKPYSSYKIVLIDFGLSSVQSIAEAKGVDLYVLEKAIISTHSHSKPLLDAIFATYEETWENASVVLNRLELCRIRGRKRDMIG